MYRMMGSSIIKAARAPLMSWLSQSLGPPVPGGAGQGRAGLGRAAALPVPNGAGSWRQGEGGAGRAHLQLGIKMAHKSRAARIFGWPKVALT